MNPLLLTISKIGQLSDALQQDLCERLISVKYKKKELILREGEVCNYLFYVGKGLLRSYSILDGNEVSSLFMDEGDFAISPLSFYTREPSNEFIEVMDDCELWGLHYDDLQELYKAHVELNVIGRIFTEFYFCLAEGRSSAMRKRSAEDRYNFLVDKKSYLLGKVPLHALATYLGISPETASRMRARGRG